MARWKTLLLAGALGCWPALGFAQGSLPVPPDQGVPALPPGAMTSAPVSATGSTLSKPARVSLSDMGGSRGFSGSGVPDISGMPKPEGNMMYTGMMQGGDQAAGTFMPAGSQNFAAGCPVCVEPCGTTIQARGPSGVLFESGVSWLRARRSDPSVLSRTFVDNGGFGDITTGVQEDYDQTTGASWYIGGGYLWADGWFGMISYRKYRDTVHNDRLVNDGSDPNFTLDYIGPGPLGSGAGGGDVPVGGFLDRNFSINWTNLDVMGGVVISPARCFDLIFSAGLRISKLEQNYDVFIDRGDGSTNSQALYSRLQGAGPRIGLESRIYPLSPVTLYAKAYTTMLYADRLEQATTSFFAADGSFSSNVASYSRQEIMPVLELSTGIDVSLFGGRVIVGGGYDFNYLFEAGSTYTEQATNPRAARHTNLAIDGANLHVTFLW